MTTTRRAGRVLAATMLAASAVLALAAPAYAAPPSNDDRASAQPVMLGETVTGDTTEATLEAGEVGNSCSVGYPGGEGGNTVWYALTLSSPATVGATLDSATDQAVAVYDASFTEVGCADDAPGGVTETLSWSGAAEDQFFISVARFDSGDEGPFSLTVAEQVPAGPSPLEATPALDFGQVSLGTQSDEQAITLTNTSEFDLDVALVGTAGSGPGYFVAGTSSTCVSTEQGPQVPAMSSCEFSIAFEPQDVGTSTLTLEWQSPDDGTVWATTELSGEGIDGSPPPDVPEAPMALLLPGSTLLLGAGVYLVRRRSHRVTAG